MDLGKNVRASVIDVTSVPDVQARFLHPAFLLGVASLF
jgi:hypothetical protein